MAAKKEAAKAAPTVDSSRWIVVYPAYLNARQTVQRGRLVAKHLACDNPTVAEMTQAAKTLGLEAVAEVRPLLLTRPPFRLALAPFLLTSPLFPISSNYHSHIDFHLPDYDRGVGISEMRWEREATRQGKSNEGGEETKKRRKGGRR